MQLRRVLEYVRVIGLEAGKPVEQRDVGQRDSVADSPVTLGNQFLKVSSPDWENLTGKLLCLFLLHSSTYVNGCERPVTESRAY